MNTWNFFEIILQILKFIIKYRNHKFFYLNISNKRFWNYIYVPNNEKQFAKVWNYLSPYTIKHFSGLKFGIIYFLAGCLDLEGLVLLDGCRWFRMDLQNIYVICPLSALLLVGWYIFWTVLAHLYIGRSFPIKKITLLEIYLKIIWNLF